MANNIPIVGTTVDPESGLLSFLFCTGDPNIVAKQSNTYAANCILIQVGFIFAISLHPVLNGYINTGTPANPVWTSSTLDVG